MFEYTSVIDFGYDDDDPNYFGCYDKKLFKAHELDTDVERDYSEEPTDNYEPQPSEIKAIALYAFTPENDNELALQEDQLVIISYEYGQGWLVAQDPRTGETGLVPEEYVHFVDDEQQIATNYGEESQDDVEENILVSPIETKAGTKQDEWVDVASDD
ncbi:HOG (high osmolarity glycerol) pathway protein [Komagataella phaffii CBS 7435]|uniref:Protein involved in the HOG (High osmolarity glycerol) pathway n=2 Tax=Komagataella phaffii TaxID=460519 RepID=C4QVQ8_KOMPG|nr:Protein involved in the HOG (high osmolarity glycerol) pathway [Komagataella phaffii GS115]AOA60808.1 GQ67_02530T0 [Komagataella phaffii]CAH2445988.1 HOG (high osmolarity glycerol) pathway protein [Komagataella phaffii CBS 7435]AOA65694.1 GQ68_02717T0 [Komagataella phaffii GS115]CAY67331.1 Protein involved in the HOG (high osmolarity glycerol) pathway [Komagataella phaffii GS115]CCA36434.1 HOG (high osmolarity glycerol) pathway protein [Komagataella phaffii CBS 7435]